MNQWSSMSDFDTDLAHVEKIRATIHDMRKNGLRGMVPQEEALHLLSFIDNLWKAYTFELNRAADQSANEQP